MSLTQEQKQEFFNKSVAGLASQGFTRAVGRSGSMPLCCYRGEGGKKCAVGHLIPDEKYDPEMDTKGGLSGALRALGIDPAGWSLQFFADLQAAHDNAFTYDEQGVRVDDPELMKRLLRRHADQYRLEIPEEIVL